MTTDFASAIRVLMQSGVSFVLVGAYAAAVQGFTQVTRDLDLCYERTPENMRRLVSALKPFHPRLRGAPEGIRFILDERTLAQGMNFTLETDLGEIDLLGELSGVGRFPELLADAISLELYGQTVRVASLDSIIRSKRAAGRPKDISALAELEGLNELQKQVKSGGNPEGQ